MLLLLVNLYRVYNNFICKLEWGSLVIVPLQPLARGGRKTKLKKRKEEKRKPLSADYNI